MSSSLPPAKSGPANKAAASAPAEHWYAPAQLVRLFEQTPVSLAYWGSDQRLRMCSPQWCDWFRLEASGIIGRPLSEVLPADYLALHQDHFEAVARGQNVQFDDSRTDAFGAEVWRHVSLSPNLPQFATPDANGVVPCDGVLMMLVDASREHAREEMIHRQRAQIEELQEELLAHQNDAAQLDKLRALLDWRTAMLTEHNEMLQLLSHEIRQPLNNASAAMQATMKAIEGLHLADTLPATKALARAEHVLQQVIGTLDNTLAAGTILAVGGKAGAASETDLPTLLGLVMHDLAADQRTRVETIWHSNVRTVQLHPALMRLTIRNLLNNALSYAPEDTQVELRISESDDPLALIIEVADQGPGIPEELRPRLFEKGSRGNNSKNRSGAGLGLFIVQAVLQAHQGTVEVLSNEPQGTIMRLVIPQGLAD